MLLSFCKKVGLSYAIENNPEVMNELAGKLGLSPELTFYDVYSLEDPEMLAHIPRPALALLVIIPLTPAWDAHRKAEDEEAAGKDQQQQKPDQDAERPDKEEAVLWFPQTIGHACGSIGLLHSVVNGPATDLIRPGSDLAEIRRRAMPLSTEDRAALLYNSEAFERAHRSVERAGDSAVDEGEREGGHFVSFVKSGGTLWELEGSRRGPLARGSLAEDEDVLSPRALENGIKRIIQLNKGGENLNFSVIALAAKV